MPNLKKEDKIKIVKKSIQEKRSMGFASMWYLPASMKKLKKQSLAESQQLRTLFTKYEEELYTIVLLDGDNLDISYWVIWKDPNDMHRLSDAIYQGFIRIDNKKTACEILSHAPSPKVGFNGQKLFSVCRYCKMIIETTETGANDWVLSEQLHTREIRS